MAEVNDNNSIQLFENQKIRTAWDAEKEEWYFAIVDVIAVLTDSANPQIYWRVLKKRLKDEGNETVTNCNALKLTAPDGKKRKTDVANTEQLLRIIQSTKVNIVKLADGNFLKAVHHIGETKYPDIEVQERLVDAMAAKMADPEFTKGCEVFVLPNLYGDRTAKLEKDLDICCNTEKKLVVTTDKDGATSEEFTTYLLDTLKAL